MGPSWNLERLEESEATDTGDETSAEETSSEGEGVDEVEESFEEIEEPPLD